MVDVEVTSGEHTWVMHKELINNLDIIKHNQNDDWDFKCLTSGDGMTRTGKSTITFQMAQYCDPTFARNWKERVVFNGERLIDVARNIPKGKVIVYDEARETLDSKKQMETYTKNLLDFFSQCGNLNHIVFIVLPEFFELPKSIAMTQSIFLVNCFTKPVGNKYQRGHFEFYDRVDKRALFIKGKMFNDYASAKPTFTGRFNNYIPFDRKEYEALKNKTLQEMRQDKKENKKLVSAKYKQYFVTSLRNMVAYGVKQKEIALYFDIGIRHVRRLIKSLNNEDINLQKEDDNMAEDLGHMSHLTPDNNDYNEEDEKLEQDSEKQEPEKKRNNNMYYNNGIYIPDEHLKNI